MEARMKKNRQLSPDRAKVWTEKSPKYQQCRKVPVVYYLCRNRHLEHPHFIEVPLLSPDGLYLKDVIKRLNVLRGRGMPSMYSWSCKRSYKSGFVWHDICEDDLILPTNGNEYVLKGSELFDESNSDCFSPIGNLKSPNPKQLQDLVSSRSRDESSSSSSMNGKETKNSQEEDDISPPLQRPVSTAVSPHYREGKNTPSRSPLSLIETKADKTSLAADASTQTEETVSKPFVRETCTRGVSTDERVLEDEPDECNEIYESHSSRLNAGSIITRDSHSPLCSSSASSSAARTTDTLESLIRADAGKMNSFRILEEDDAQMPTNVKLKAANILLQVISCGSIAVKDHGFGLNPTYKPRFLHSKFVSPFYTGSIMFGELDCLSESSRTMGLKLEDKEYFSGSVIETNNLKERENLSSLKRSSSYNADRRSKQPHSVEYKDAATSGRSKCNLQPIRASITKQPRCESMRSPLSDGPRNSSDGLNCLRRTPPSKSNGSSKRFTGLSNKEEKEKIITIEERLASGARVIIQSKASCDQR